MSDLEESRSSYSSRLSSYDDSDSAISVAWSSHSVLVPHKRPRPPVPPPASPGDIYDDLNTVFEWNPENLMIAAKRKDNSPGRGNRDLSFYGMHLAPALTLKRVVHVPQLHKQLARVVDIRMDSLRERGITLPPAGYRRGIYVREDTRGHLIESDRREMRNEIDVAQYLYRSIPRFSLPIASALTFHPEIWLSVLRWSDHPQEGCHAIVNGTFGVEPLRDGLTRRGPDGEPKATVWDYIDEENFKHLREIDRRYRTLATWQILKVSIGVDDVMPRLMTMVYNGAFQWKRCRGDPCMKPLNQNQFRSGHDSADTLMFATDSLTDATPSGATTPLPPSVRPPSPPVAKSHSQILDEAFVRGGSSLEKFQSLDEIHQEFIAEQEEASRKRREARANGTGGWKPPGYSYSAWPDSATQRFPGESEAGSLDLAPDTLLMEAWIQSIRDNSTLVILHSGNLEFICVRHRESQTLYVSDILHLPCMEDPKYGKTALGVYLLAIDDAIRRNQLDSAVDDAPEPPAGVDDIDESDAQTDASDESAKKKSRTTPPPTNRRGRSGRKRGKRKAVAKEKTELTENVIPIMLCPLVLKADSFLKEMMEEIASSARSVLLMHFKYDLYDTVNPGIFFRGIRLNSAVDTSSPPPTTPVTRFSKDDRILLVLTSELGEGAVGVVHGGVVRVESSHRKTTELKIAAKLAFTPRQQKALIHEMEVYKRLSSKGVEGVPKILGEWHDADEGGPSCVIMSHAGLSLRDRGGKITPEQRDGFMAILKSIHAAGVSHEDLRSANLMIDDAGNPVIIDFERSWIDGDEVQYKKEPVLLRRILDAKTMKRAPHAGTPADTGVTVGKGKKAESARPVGGKRKSEDRDDVPSAQADDSKTPGTSKATAEKRVGNAEPSGSNVVHGPRPGAGDGDGASLRERRAGGMTLRPLKRK
ncbi:hypothetical protein PLICRDRAFT_180463 [Plicaturopsis crispa FD-325 SS-3]|uniref:Protein kinase domain-containing protein n=1 Tax=Plicaturopsis crispa FD-325 SS-3 TaxID=944288 RepID=A0A0C9SKA2_PLICR|nr:hypothetical protein PLICRDRAFT_180463 [Plicaturopsis crispa FD-325 SS-3]